MSPSFIGHSKDQILRFLGLGNAYRQSRPKEHVFDLRQAGWLLTILLVFSSALALAEDFSVHLEKLAETDTRRPVPEYKLDRVLLVSETNAVWATVERTFAVFIRFKDFGSVQLSESRQVLPSAGSDRGKRAEFSSGLASLQDVKAGWLKNAPDLLVVAWVDEPDARGVGHDFGHQYVILQVSGRSARVLLRGDCALTTRIKGGIWENPLLYSHFSFDPRRSLLREEVTRSYQRGSDAACPLCHPVKDEDGKTILVADIDETIALTYRFAHNTLVPRSASLIYKSQDRDQLADIAHFYLGPFAPARILLEANPNLSPKYKRKSPSGTIYPDRLDAGLDIRVPVPQQWLMQQFGHETETGSPINSALNP